MKKIILFSAILAFTVLAVDAQEEPVKDWTSSGTIGLNFSQSHLSNWAAGGEDAMNWQGIFKYGINYAKDKQKWENNLAFSFKSQFAEGFDYKTDSTNPISKFLAPAYITLGLGMEWVPSKVFSLNFAPVTGRITIVNDQNLADAGAFGVDPAEYDANTGVKLSDGKTSRFEFGTKMTAKLNVDIAENVNFTSKLELFSDYLKNPQNIDMDWQNLVTMKVNSWLNANISAQMIYDDDIMITDKDGNTGPRLQFKEVLSLGLSYNFK